MKKNILVPFDGSPNASEALRFAAILAKALQEKIIVLNVQPSFHTAHTKMFFKETTIRDYQEQLSREILAAAQQVLASGGVEYEVKLRIGDAKEQICLEAQEADGDGSSPGVRLIVMGSRGMNPVLGGVLGSVSYGVVNAAQCPVTIIPCACAE